MSDDAADDGDDEAKVVPLAKRRPLRTDESEKLIRERCKDSSKVIVARHAFDRIRERSITRADLDRILEKGFVTDQPVRADHDDGWKVVVSRRMPGMREAAAVTIILDPPSDKLFVMTVEWLDV